MTHPLSFASDLILETPVPIPKHPLVIAEIGINHNGDIDIAKKLIDLAHSAGCDLVKFQKRTIETVYSKDVLDSPRESPWGTTQREQKLALEFGRSEYDEIDRHCGHLGIGWFASAWDRESLAFLRQYDMPYNKIASAMLTHHDFVKTVASEQKTTFISTGMSSFEDIDRVVAVFRAAACPFVLMHTVAEYPTPDSMLNLRVIDELRRRYSCPVGYSGHEATMVPSVIAAMLGAVAIERHVTLDRAMYGTDQAASLERRGLEMMVGYVRTIPIVLGNGVKEMTEGERKNAAKLRYWSSTAGAAKPKR
jgi:N-acetylneuraminate synthase